MIRLLFFSLFLNSVAAQAELLLRWAADPNSNAPYAFYSKGKNLIGFESEIINAVANRLGRRAEFVENDWNGLIPGLQRGLYDCVIAGIEITPDKAEQVTLSVPYYYTFEQFVGRRGAPAITSLEQLKDRKVGTLDQTAALRILEETPGVIVKSYDQELSAYEDIVNGRLFGVLLDYPIAKYYAAPNPALELTGPPFGQIAYGIAINKNNGQLKSEIDSALGDIIRSGELRNILSRWGLWTNNVAKAFDQPEPPSTRDTEYQAFVASQTSLQNFWSRLESYGGSWQLLGNAALLTLVVSITAMMVAIGFGMLLVICRLFAPLPVRWFATTYIEVIRGTPLLIQLLFIFYGLPKVGLQLSPFVASVLGLGLNYAASEAENYRAGLLSVPEGQWQAARALGLTQSKTLRLVIVPQAVRLVLPPLTNDFIALLKDSSLVSALTLLELTGAYNRLATQTFDYFGTGLLVAMIYLLIGLPFVRIARLLERQLRSGA
ncbi:MAG TPA: ABC transporter substrate-binding protein/permease [Chthoniobacterales bacterium]|nr:ABC transporter substrate-binding protein/permease [Chthoniobacterales bacterium]